MIFIRRSAAPEILLSSGKNKRRALCAAYTRNAGDYMNGTRKFRFDNTVYGHKTVKETLNAMQHGNCCFCESKITHISFGDVEHFRPKAGYKQNGTEKLQTPGYYWLVYDWENLLLSCERCNREYNKEFVSAG